jgi:NADH-ubiquinone oxidoreductase chain 5
MRRFGGLFNIIPFTASMILLGSITLIGFPFLTGFYSKDVILEISYSKYTLMGILAYIFGLSSAFCTSFYSYRLFYLTFIQKNVTNRLIIYKTHELPQRMAYILSILGLGSIFFGYFTRELFIGLGSDFFLDVIYISYQNNNQIESEFLPQIIKLIPF